MTNSLKRAISLIILLWLGTAGAAFSQSAEEWVRRGDAFDAGGQTREALAAYLEAVQKGPQTSALLHRVAKQFGLSMNLEATEAGKQAAAENALGYAKRSVAADPKSADARVALAICYGRLIRFQDTRVQIEWSRLVKESTEEALRLDPENELGWYLLGAWHYELAGLNPIKRGLARLIYGSLPPASDAEAVRCFRKAIALNPARMASYVDLGLTYARTGDESSARQMLALGLALPNRDPDDPAVRVRGQKALADL